MNKYTFNKKWGKYGYEYYYVKCDGKYHSILRNYIYICTVCRDMTPDECDEYLTKNMFDIDRKMAKQLALD